MSDVDAVDINGDGIADVNDPNEKISGNDVVPYQNIEKDEDGNIDTSMM